MFSSVCSTPDSREEILRHIMRLKLQTEEQELETLDQKKSKSPFIFFTGFPYDSFIMKQHTFLFSSSFPAMSFDR